MKKPPIIQFFIEKAEEGVYTACQVIGLKINESLGIIGVPQIK